MERSHERWNWIGRVLNWVVNMVLMSRSGALINLGFDDAAAGQHDQALSSLEQTLARVEEEAMGSHRWRWRMKLLIGVAELRLHTRSLSASVTGG